MHTIREILLWNPSLYKYSSIQIITLHITAWSTYPITFKDIVLITTDTIEDITDGVKHPPLLNFIVLLLLSNLYRVLPQ